MDEIAIKLNMDPAGVPPEELRRAGRGLRTSVVEQAFARVLSDGCRALWLEQA